jgi:protein involved in polysaccharide export with SLBB domain
VIWVLDEVRDPGAYVAGDGTSLADMIETAGGLLRTADLSSVEVTSTQIDALSGTSQTVRTSYKGSMQDFRRVSLQPLDVIRLRPVFSDRQDGRVTLLGQVRYPGTFDITRGERLSSVLERVGGLTEQAYPYAAVFTRTRAQVAEREANVRTSRELDAQLATLTTLASSPTAQNPNAIAYLSSLAQRVRDAPALGRITVTADPVVLRMKPELDVILEPGDTLYIPPRPSTITVSGEVLNAGSFQYRAGLTVRDYVTLAGDATQSADKGRIFVIFPDGTAQPAKESWLSFGNSNVIPPGSTIVVPRDLRPFDLTQFLRDATLITSQLAITAASLSVLGR